MKKEQPEHIIVYAFQSIEDPLVKGLMLQYLVDLSLTKNWIFHLITHEQPSFRLNPERANSLRVELIEKNIFWYPINYHNGRFLILKKGFDFIKSALICTKIKLKFKPRKIIGFLPIAAGFSAILAPILRLKLITYCFEPHSEYMADFGIWNRKSIKYLLLKKYERSQIEISRHIIVPTHHTRELIENWNPYAKIHELSISIDTDLNIRNLQSRSLLRKEWNVESKKVILYMGKFGGIYYDIKTVLDFLNKFNKDLFHILIISSDKKDIDTHIKNTNLQASFFTVLDFIPYTEIHKFISASDLGILAVPSLPSQKYRTPVKTALYLACGVPYLVNKGIAEDDTIAEKYKVGCVMDDFVNTEMTQLLDEIDKLFLLPNLSENCRNVAVNLRSHQNAVKLLESILIEK